MTTQTEDIGRRVLNEVRHLVVCHGDQHFEHPDAIFMERSLFDSLKAHLDNMSMETADMIRDESDDGLVVYSALVAPADVNGIVVATTTETRRRDLFEGAPENRES